MESLGEGNVDSCKSSYVGRVLNRHIPCLKFKTGNVWGKRGLCFRIRDKGSDIELYTVRNRGLKTNSQIDIPKVFHLKVGPERGAIKRPGNIIREVGEIIGALYKGPDSEGLIERIKPLGPQRPEVFPVVLKIIFGSHGRTLRRTEGVQDF